MAYQILSSLFKLTKRMIKLQKILKKEEDEKECSENFINECNKLLSIIEKNDTQKVIVSSFFHINNNIIEWSLKYCSKNTKEIFEKNKSNFFSNFPPINK